MPSSGSTSPAEGYRLTDISPRAFQHPADRAASAALKAIPHLDRVVRKLIELGYERALRQSYLGSSVRLSEEQLGAVWREHAMAYATLDLEDVPDLYLTQVPAAERDDDRRAQTDRGRAVRARAAARRRAAPRGVRPRGRARALRPPALPHRAGDPDRADAHRAPAAAARAGAHRAAGVESRDRAELRPRRGARDARPARRLPHADVDRRRRDGRRARPRRLHAAGPGIQARAGEGSSG